MAISKARDIISSQTKAAATSYSVVCASVAAGNVIVVRFALAHLGIDADYSVSTDIVGGQVQIDKIIDNASGVRTVIVSCYCPSGTPATGTGRTVTLSFGSNSVGARCYAAMELTGCDTGTGRADSINAGDTGSGTAVSGSDTTLTAGCFLIAVTGIDGANTVTITLPSGWTTGIAAGTTGGADVSLKTAYRVTTTATAYPYAPTLNTALDWALGMVAYRTPPASAGVVERRGDNIRAGSRSVM